MNFLVWYVSFCLWLNFFSFSASPLSHCHVIHFVCKFGRVLIIDLIRSPSVTVPVHCYGRSAIGGAGVSQTRPHSTEHVQLGSGLRD